MTGTLAFNRSLSSVNKLIDLQQGYSIYSDNVGGSNNTRLWIDTPNDGEVVIGPRAGSNFLNDIRLRSQIIKLETNGNQNGVTINENKVWHAGNDGSGSGLDADLLDGKHWSDIKSYIDANAGSIVAQSLGTNGYVKFNTGLIIQWGRLPSVRWNTPTTGNFTIPFPNACLSVQATHGTSVGHTYAIGIWILSKSQFCVRAGDIDTHIYYPVYWLAIGY